MNSRTSFRRARRRRRSIPIAMILVSLAVFPVGAQPPAEAPGQVKADETFFESIDVNIVNVDVVVLDKEGNPVTGLTRDDFRLLEDGDPVEITNFFAVRGGRPDWTEELGDLTPQAAAVIPENQRLNLIVFVDNLNITPTSRNRILQRFEEFLRSHVRPDDRVMVVSHNGLVAIHQQLTDDTDAVAEALEEAAMEAARASMTEMEFRRVLDEIEGVAFGSGGGFVQDSTNEEATSALSAVRLYSRGRHESALATAASIKHFVNSLSAVRGRKAVLYVGDGLSANPSEALFQAWENKFRDLPRMRSVGPSASELAEFDVSSVMVELTTHANAHRVTFYAIAGGGGVLSSSSVERRGMDANSERVWTPALESIERTNRSATLEILADNTGGFAGLDVNNLGVLMDNMRRDFDFYYSLAYEPAHNKDGKYHRIEVQTVDRTLRVRHREGYRDKTAEERMTDRTQSALLLGAEDNPLGVTIDFGRDRETKEGQFEVQLIVKIPMGNVVLLPAGDFHEGRLSIYVAARDEKGRSSPVQHIPVPIRIDNDKLLAVLGQTGGYNLPLLLRPGPHTVAVAVRDELGNIDSTISAPFTPGRLVVDVN